ncbi:MAG: hypothetical protein RBT03_09655 [Kiritimatiellia bacterium]|nr:hypothetical protein [Kiritimatiellia bacterium]
MNDHIPQPDLRTEFESARRQWLRGWVSILLTAWLLVVVGDWVARLRLFRWQDQWLPTGRPATSAGTGVGAARSQLIPAQTGAGLTQMLPGSSLAARYAEFHPEIVLPFDAWGYVNSSAIATGTCSVLMVGDSFMVSLGTQTVAQVVADIGHIGVYNHARRGSGPFLELRRFLAVDRFDPPPRVVVWNLTARELGAPLFQRQAVQAWFDRTLAVDAQPSAAASRILWDHLAPAVLRNAWPNTSLTAYAARQAWRHIEWQVFREWPSDVLGADDPQFGPMLFYGENLRVLPLLTPEADAPPIVQTVASVAEGLRDRGITLVVLLVPEKEQIHARALPLEQQQALARGPELLAAITAGLTSNGIPTVNLLPVFEAATARGQRLYWRDDTHWNDAGIRLAAEELWREVEPLVK